MILQVVGTHLVQLFPRKTRDSSHLEKGEARAEALNVWVVEFYSKVISLAQTLTP